MSEFVIDFIRW